MEFLGFQWIIEVAMVLDLAYNPLGARHDDQSVAGDARVDKSSYEAKAWKRTGFRGDDHRVNGAASSGVDE